MTWDSLAWFAAGIVAGVTIGTLLWRPLFRDAYAGWMRCLDQWGDTINALERANALLEEANRHGVN